MSPESDGGTTVRRGGMPFGLPKWVGAVVPVLLLAIVVAGFLFLNPFAGFQTGGALPDVTVTHTSLPDDETVVLHVTNNGPEPVTLSQVLVNDAYWDFTMYAGGTETSTLEPMQSGRIVVPYHWTPGWDIHTGLVLADGTTFSHTIPAPQVSPELSGELLGLLAVIGLFVGVIALVFVGINGLRVGAAAALGLYPDVSVAVGSVLAALPALVGVGVGKRLRGRIGEHTRRAIVLGLLSVIGIRLLAGGFGVF